MLSTWLAAALIGWVALSILAAVVIAVLSRR